MESTWKGNGGRDAGKGVKGLGCPLYAGPWNGDGAREVWRRSRQTRMPGVLSLWFFFTAQAKRNDAERSNSRRLARRASEASQVTRREGEDMTLLKVTRMNSVLAMIISSA